MKKFIYLLTLLAIMASAVPVKGQIIVTEQNPWKTDFSANVAQTTYPTLDPDEWAFATPSDDQGWMRAGITLSYYHSRVADDITSTSEMYSPQLNLSALAGKTVYFKLDHGEMLVTGMNVDSLIVYYMINGDATTLTRFFASANETPNGNTFVTTDSIAFPTAALVENCRIVFQWKSNNGNSVRFKNASIYVPGAAPAPAIPVTLANPYEQTFDGTGALSSIGWTTEAVVGSGVWTRNDSALHCQY
jgi:hypothetical protein